MIRSVPVTAGFTFDRRGSGTRRIGDVSAALAFNPVTAGIGVATSLASAAITGWMQSIQLSHNADTATTLIVNGLAQQLSNLVNAYMSEPASCASQRAALDAYDSAWAWLQSSAACGNPTYGSAGNRCISDRAPGGKYPWQSYYRDPIANDPRLSSAGCDTGQALFLPSLQTGTYQDTGITSTGGSSTTGQTAAELAAAASASPATSTNAAAIASSAIAAAAAIPSLDSSTYLYVGLGLLGVLLLTR
jgi:hypothetical protein